MADAVSPRAVAAASWSLVKPRIVGLLLLTGLSGALAAGGPPMATLVAFVIAGAATAGGAAALNCYYDRELDRHMARTADRPLPRGALPGWAGLALGGGLLGLGTLVGWRWLPSASLAYMLLGVFAYVGLYTVGLKRRTPWATPIGGLAGAFPVLAGWAAVEPVGPAAVGLAVLVVAWTPAHAWALAHVYREEFRAAGVPTLPAVGSASRVRRSVWRWALLTAGMAALAVPLAGPLYAGALAGGLGPYLIAFRRFRTEGTEPTAVRAFFSANLFLAVLFVGWAAGGLVGAVSLPAAAAVALGVTTLFLGLWVARPSLRGVEAAAGDGSAALERLRSRVRPRAVDG
ncbi:MAG: protoheme IX farnesyltransferase [Halobacteriales archaeon]|nr:protoheme IX farnesyltransferase [Halobacteriales archaeon]